MRPAPTVFVVDDEAAMRDSLRWLLESAGLPVETYDSASGFFEGYDPERRGCLVVDVRMPGRSGLELQRELAARQFGIPIIFISGHGDVSTVVTAMKGGAFDFIEKPFGDQQILERVRAALARDEQLRRRQVRRDAARRRLAQLTVREREVLDLVVTGKTSRAIAAKLGLQQKTVELYRSRVKAKMGAANITDLVRITFRDYR